MNSKSQRITTIITHSQYRFFIPFVYIWGFIYVISNHGATQVQAFPNAPLSVSEELGCSPTLSILLGSSRSDRLKGDDKTTNDFFFDPLGLAKDDNFARYREAELKHGRVAMVGFLASWVETLAGWNKLQGLEGSGTPNTALPLSTSAWDLLLSGQTPPILKLLSTWNESYWYKFILVCGVLETLVLVQLSPQDLPGDYGLGYFGLRDKGRNERSLVSELENGRLAMLVMVYYVVQEVLPIMYAEQSTSSISLPVA